MLHAEWLRIDRADPRIFIARELLYEMLVWGTGPHADLRPGPGALAWDKRPPDVPLSLWVERASYGLRGWLLTIKGENRTVLYRITERADPYDGYVAEWPD